MNIPDFLKPTKWLLVGGFFRNLYESPGENAALGLILVLISIACLVLLGGFGVPMIKVYSIVAIFALWGIGHFIASIIMSCVFHNREQARIEQYRKRYNR